MSLDAITKLAATRYELALHIARRQVGDQDAEDVAQEAFLRLLRWGMGRGAAPITILARATRFAAIDYLRSTWGRERQRITIPFPLAFRSITERTEMMDARHALDPPVASLDPSPETQLLTQDEREHRERPIGSIDALVSRIEVEVEGLWSKEQRDRVRTLISRYAVRRDVGSVAERILAVLPIDGTHRDIAERVGTARETASRELARLERRGKVIRERIGGRTRYQRA